MENRRDVDILNELLALETGSFIARLRESGYYVSWPVAEKFATLRAMVDEDAAHENWLTDEILRLGGAPRPPALGIQTAGSHYLDAQYIMPRIAADEQRLIAAYRRAQGVVSPGASTTLRLLSLILARHEARASRLADSDKPRSCDAPSS